MEYLITVLRLNGSLEGPCFDAEQVDCAHTTSSCTSHSERFEYLNSVARVMTWTAHARFVPATRMIEKFAAVGTTIVRRGKLKGAVKSLLHNTDRCASI